ncbi:MAG: DUF935 domain-containing protein [Phyllobacteriaceae bacterium]|nr:DUF935 domain-containing protein [Phyllobacteriaceae bacterium]
MAKTFTELMRIKSPRDAGGMAVPPKTLTTEVATPTVGAVRQPISGHPAEGLTPARLAMIHRAAATGDPELYFELAEDIEERDLHYAGVMATRKRSVAQLPITVTEASDSPEHKKHAQFVRDWIAEGILEDALFDMLDAIGKGMSVLEIDWVSRHGHWHPGRFLYRPQRWFTFDREDGETVLLREGATGVPLAGHKFLIHRHPSKSGLTVRSGLARVASWAWMYKQFTLKDWAIFCQNYGQPIRLGRYDGNANEEDKAILWRAVSQIAGDCAAIVPDGMSIEFVSVTDKSSTSDLYEKRADWFDRQISKAVLGQTTTTDAVSGGHAVAKEHRLVQEDIERSDAKMISGTVNMQLVPNLIAFNFGPQDHYPRVRIGRPDEVPLGEFSTAFAALAPLGLTAPAGWMRDRMGIPAPDDNDELIGGGPASGAAEPEGIANASARLLLSRHRADPADADVARLSDRLQRDAAGALAGLTDEVRSILTQARTLQEAADGLAALDLDPTQLSIAMARGMALAHLAGQASLVDDLEAKRR